MVIFSQRWNGDRFWKFLTITIDGFWWHQPMVYHATNGLQWFANGLPMVLPALNHHRLMFFWVLWPLPTMVYNGPPVAYQWLPNGKGPLVKQWNSFNGLH